MHPLSDSEARNLLLKLAYEKLYGNKKIKDEAFAEDLGISRTQLHKIRKNEKVGEKSLDMIAMFVAHLTFKVWKGQKQREINEAIIKKRETILAQNVQLRLDDLGKFIQGLKVQIKKGLFKRTLNGDEFFNYANAFIRKNYKTIPNGINAPYLDLAFPHRTLVENLMVKYKSPFQQFFNLIEAVVDTIESSEVPDSNRIKYAHALKAILSESQLVCLYLFTIAKEGENLRSFMVRFFITEKLHLVQSPEYVGWVEKYKSIFDDIFYADSRWTIKDFIDRINSLLDQVILFWFVLKKGKELNGGKIPEILSKISKKTILGPVYQFNMVNFSTDIRQNEIVIFLILIPKEKVPGFAAIEGIDCYYTRLNSIDVSQFISDIMYDRLILRRYSGLADISRGNFKIEMKEPLLLPNGGVQHEVSYIFKEDFFQFPFNPQFSEAKIAHLFENVLEMDFNN